ncbi:hypothetical protein FD17_GL000959 [Lentilactobacillus sunkii DSM 19904]|uniref:Uncharacterized protein n=2 Tax=Lentilactobacillus sunkii TaxID=481719 RepID=A0A0R1KWB7_9LACO|nr:hypothetical protein FD17_GL000959 [Lentilactobacillus sunkii DSM 19904]
MLEARDLKAIDKTIYQAPQQTLLARSLIKPYTDIPQGATSYRYYVSRSFGKAKLADERSNDIPMVDTDLTPVDQSLFRIEVGATWTDEELQQAHLAGFTPNLTKIATAARAIAEKENQIVFLGDDTKGIKGLFNSPDATVTTNDAGPFSKITDSGAIVEVIRKARKALTLINGFANIKPVLGLAPNAYEELNRRYSDYDSRSIMAVLQANGWFSDIVSIPELKGAGDGGKDSLVIFDNQPDTMQVAIGTEMTRSQEEIVNFWTHRIALYERLGGIILRRPYLVNRVDNV